MTDAHDGDEIREGRTRAQSRARNQQEAVGLLCDLGPVAGHQILRALIAETGTRSMLEPCDLPTELIQDADPEPNTYAEANASQYAELWRRAMSDEFQGLLAAGTFALSGLVPEGNKILTARWIFKWKSDENGNVTKAKDRLVARGCGQDIDPSDTSSPTPSASTVRLLVALACKYEWDLNHFDRAGVCSVET